MRGLCCSRGRWRLLQSKIWIWICPEKDCILQNKPVSLFPSLNSINRQPRLTSSLIEAKHLVPFPTKGPSPPFSSLASSQPRAPASSPCPIRALEVTYEGKDWLRPAPWRIWVEVQVGKCGRTHWLSHPHTPSPYHRLLHNHLCAPSLPLTAQTECRPPPLSLIHI